MEIQGSSFIQAIVAQLRSSPTYSAQHIYTERQTQGLQRPCFFIEELPLSQEQQLQNRYRREYRWKISWLPPLASTSQVLSCLSVAEDLRELFALFSVADSKVRPTFMESEIVDGGNSKELRFTIDAVVHVVLPKPDASKMQVLHQTEHIK